MKRISALPAARPAYLAAAAAVVIGLVHGPVAAQPGAAQAAVAQAGPAVDVEALAAGFRDPPQSARPRTWWHWTGGNVTLEGITRDLEWMQRVGIAGFQLADVSSGSGQTARLRAARRDGHRAALAVSRKKSRSRKRRCRTLSRTRRSARAACSRAVRAAGRVNGAGAGPPSAQPLLHFSLPHRRLRKRRRRRKPARTT